MRLSALDIKKQEFTRVLRGYDPDEVHAYLAELARQWEEMQAEVRRSEDRINEMAGKMEHYQRVEEALQEALQTAREGSKQALDNAKQEAALIVKKAMGEADDLTRAAERRRDALEQEVETLRRHRDEVVARLRAFLNAESEILARFTDREGFRSDFARDGADAPTLDPAAAAETTVPSGPDTVAREPDLVPRRLPELEARDAGDAAPGEDVEKAFGGDDLDAGLREVDQPPAEPVAPLARADAALDDDELPEIAALDDEPVDAGEEERAVSFEMTLEDEDAFAVAEEGLAVEASAEAVESVPVDDQPEARAKGLVDEAAPNAAILSEDVPEADEEEKAPVLDEEDAGPDAEDVPTFDEDDEPEYASETDSLTFRFFEPNEGHEEEADAQEEAGPSYGPDQQPRPKRSSSYTFEDDFASGDTDTWIVPPAEESDEPASEDESSEPKEKEGLAASSEELEKIKRILSDLD